MHAAHLVIGKVTRNTCACSTLGMQHIALQTYHCQMHSLDGDNRLEYCLVCSRFTYPALLGIWRAAAQVQAAYFSPPQVSQVSLPQVG